MDRLNRNDMDVLAIEELLRLIFQFCDRRDNFRNALVSKKWSREALSALWNHLDTPHPLLALLAPMVKKDIIYEFERPLWSHDWAIFQKYSWRVHRISFPFIGTNLYSHSVFTEIALTRPQGDLIPNLRNLKCQPYSLCDFIPLLLSQRLAVLAIHGINGTSLPKVHSLLSYIPDRCPALNRLDLRVSHYDFTEIGLDVGLARLSSLTELEITPATLTPRVMHALARLPNLEYIRSTQLWPTKGQNQLPRPPVDTSERFTSLRLLEISPDNAPPFLEIYRLNNLRKLVIEPDTQQTREQYLRLFKLISMGCPQLEVLHVLKWNRHYERPLKLPLVTPESFEPVHHLSRLTDLSLPDLPMTPSALLYLAENLPSLKHLALHRTTSHDGLPICHITLLSQLAAIRPQLVSLCLCIKTNLRACTLRASVERFQCLAELNVGPSRLKSSPVRVAAYLSGILPEGCQLTYLKDGYIRDSGQQSASWGPVIEMLPALIAKRSDSPDSAASLSSTDTTQPLVMFAHLCDL